MSRRSSDPFHITLARLLAEREMTPYALSRRCREQSGWGSANGVNEIARGNLVPGIEGMEAIARALEVAPETFAEYRLQARRRELDWRAVGLRAALKSLGE